MVSIQLKFVTLCIVLIIFLTSIIPNFIVLAEHTQQNYSTNSKIPNSYLIEDIPYTSQETNFFCGFATVNMILNYYQLNTTLHEIIYNSGVGYSIGYNGVKNNYLPTAGWLICQGALTNNFISDIYGVSYYTGVFDSNLDNEQKWDQYWQYIKQHIINDTPIVVLANQIILAADDYNLNNALPFFKILLPRLTNGHSILVVGFNEHNNSVCYHDPQYGLYNASEKGFYRWIDKDVFKLATQKGSPGLWVKYFYNTSEHQVSKKDAFLLSHHRNIEKLKGNFSLYYKEYPELEYDENTTYGIEALKSFREDLQKGINSQIKTISTYKKNNGIGIIYRVIRFLSSISDIQFFLLWRGDVFEHIALEKQYTAEYLNRVQYLFSDDNISLLCNYEIDLLNKEVENWTKLAKNYSFFRKWGIFIPLRQAVKLIQRMFNLVDNIINIQEKIIAGPFADSHPKYF
jgi:hypothetical protein